MWTDDIYMCPSMHEVWNNFQCMMREKEAERLEGEEEGKEEKKKKGRRRTEAALNPIT